MDISITPKDLRDFELEIFDLFSQAKIASPIHLRGGNEEILIEIFKDIKPQDYCFCTWASHLECLLKGVTRENLRAAILQNKSICLSFEEHNIISSAIVGGNAPLAVGTAMGLKMLKSDQHVWCFVGDMSFYTGTVQESLHYAEVHDLPITFIIADNGHSVTTPTAAVWGNDIEAMAKRSSKCLYYTYENVFPHAGTGTKVLF